MEKILEALKKLIPADQLTEVAGAVDEVLAEAKRQLEEQMNAKLEEGYAIAAQEVKDAEKVAHTGYLQAWEMIQDGQNRLALQMEECESFVGEQYREAWEMIEEEKKKNNTLELELHQEYENELAKKHSYFVDKVHEFFHAKGPEIYEQARRDILNDPRTSEHRVALDQIVDITSKYISDEDRALATTSKLEEAKKQLEDLKAQVKMAEARTIRLSRENTKLTEEVRKQGEILTESHKVAEKKERVQKASQVSGRGHKTLENTVLIGEHVEETPSVKRNTNHPLGNLDELRELAGLK